MRTISFIAVLGLLVSCKDIQPPSSTSNPVATPTSKTASSQPKVEPTKTPAPTPPSLRLGDLASPTRYSLDLHLDPTKERFDGEISIDLHLSRKTKLLWLNATGIELQDAKLSIAGKELSATPVKGDENFLGLSFTEELSPGDGKLSIRYQGLISPKDTDGVFRQKEGDSWYLYTQFEAISARRAFPCFDEPSYKVPWQLTVHIPKGNIALSNTPITEEADEEGGLHRVSFAETKALPSYLVAFAVGPFELVDAGKSKGGAVIRVATPKGHIKEASYSSKVSADILSGLEEYFGQPYPFEKLDLLVIPDTVGFSAMENPGLITFATRVLLMKPEQETAGFHRRCAGVTAHEMGHMWFGDLVTMAWWDDIWLNEAFASWIAEKVIQRWKPDWKQDESRVSSRVGVQGADSLITARQIRQPIKTNDDISNAFDGITYTKGKAVLNMFEDFVGEKKFQEGVRGYLAAHARGNATSEDFAAAVSKAAGFDVGPAFSSFLAQPGVPLVSAELSCVKGETPKLLLSQQRYLPKGSKGDTSTRWRLPICARYPVGKKDARDCTMLEAEKGELVLASAKSCPAWVLPNAGAGGYYYTQYQGDLLKKLLGDGGKALSAPERLGVFGDASALAERGDLPLGDVLAYVPTLLKTADRALLSSTVGLVAGLAGSQLVPEALRPNYQRMIQKLYGEKVKALGFSPKAEEDDETKLLRPMLIGLVGGEADDATLQAKSLELAKAWLKDRSAVSPELADTVLYLAARGGDHDLYDAYLKEAKVDTDRRERSTLLGSLGAFKDQKIIGDALALILTDTFDAREAINIFWSVLGNEESRELAYTFVTKNFDTLVEKLPKDYGARLARAGGIYCDEGKKSEVETFFTGRSTKYSGGPRILAQVLEGISLCSAYREAQSESVATFLKGY